MEVRLLDADAKRTQLGGFSVTTERNPPGAVANITSNYSGQHFQINLTSGLARKASAPRFVRIVAKWNVRGGIATHVVAEHRKKGWKPAPAVDLAMVPASAVRSRASQTPASRLCSTAGRSSILCRMA